MLLTVRRFYASRAALHKKYVWNPTLVQNPSSARKPKVPDTFFCAPPYQRDHPAGGIAIEVRQALK